MLRINSRILFFIFESFKIKNIYIISALTNPTEVNQLIGEIKLTLRNKFQPIANSNY
jgi:hypothetical protein